MVTVVVELKRHRAVRESWASAWVTVREVVEGEGVLPGEDLQAVGSRLGLAQAGESLRLDGDLTIDPRWGLQLQVRAQEALGIRAPDTAHRWLERLDGVGPGLARRIFEHFGAERVLQVLASPPGEGEPDELLDVRGVGASTATTIRESWTRVGASGNPEDLALCARLGLGHFETNVVIAFAGKQHKRVADLLRDEPYTLVEANGFGFSRADSVALKAGVAREAPARLEAALVFQLGELCNADTFCSRGQLVKQTAELCGVGQALALEALTRVIAAKRVAVTRDEGTWVHPAELLDDERTIYEALRPAEAAGSPETNPAPALRLSGTIQPWE